MFDTPPFPTCLGAVALLLYHKHMLIYKIGHTLLVLWSNSARIIKFAVDNTIKVSYIKDSNNSNYYYIQVEQPRDLARDSGQRS